MNAGLRISAALVVVLIGGCAKAPLISNMIPLKVSQPILKSEHTLMIGEVTGGSETHPMLHSQIDSTGFREALTVSLRKSSMFKRVTAKEAGDSDYTLEAEILSQELKRGFLSRSITPTTTLLVRYALTDHRKGQEVWAENIFAEYQAKPKVEFRRTGTRRANEGAARENLTHLVKSLGVFMSQTRHEP
jgi:hypothetical protein